MSLLVRPATRDSDILDLGVGAYQFTVAIISQDKNPGKSPCERSCCWLSNCYMLRLSRIRPRVFKNPEPIGDVVASGLQSSYGLFHFYPKCVDIQIG